MVPIKYFSLSEFKCKHCGEVKMDEDFLIKLDRLRELCGFPLKVTSGYRCPEHNVAVSTTGPQGPHTTGRAVDLGVSRHRAYTVIQKALATGDFTGIGVQQKGESRFIHLDDLEEPEHAPRPTIWSY